MPTTSKTIELGKFDPPVEAYSVGSATNDGAISNLEFLLSNVIGVLTTLGAIFFVVNFIIGAFQWISSGGDKGKLETARNKMLNGVIGMIVLIAAYAIIGLISGLVGYDLLNPGKAIEKLNPTTTNSAPAPSSSSWFARRID